MNISYSKQYINYQDIEYVSKSLKSNLITGGRYVEKFEKRLKKFLRVKFLHSCSNGTAAIYLVMKSINIKKNDIVIMPAINFIASYSSAKHLNAKIFLADVDPITGQMTPETLEECIKKNKIKTVKLIVTMYLGGSPNNVAEFYKIKKKYNAYLLEDACHALGASYKSNRNLYKVGQCKHSDFATFSFHPVKSITTGEGGAISTNSKKISNKIVSLVSHGIKKKKYWDYNISSLSFNFRLSDINCALGISQLLKINDFLKSRKKARDYYVKKIKKDKVLKHYIEFNENNDVKSAYHLFIVSFKDSCFFDKKKFFKFMNQKKIFPQIHYKPIYKFTAYREKKIKLKNSEYYFKNSISLPLYFNISKSIQDKIIKNLKNYLLNN